MTTTTTRALVDRLAELLSEERVALADFLLALADFLLALADFDRQRRWAELGYAHLFDFLVRELGMSRGTAFYRKTAVALVQQYPEVLEPLRDGRLCITAVHALSRVLTPDNRAEVLPRLFHVSKQTAKVIAAEIAPVVDVPRRDVVTLVPSSAPRAAPAPALDLGHEANRLAPEPAGPAERIGPPASASTLSPREPAAAPVPARSTVEPLTAREHRLHLTVTPEFVEMLDACKKALSHAMPGADAAAVLAEGMQLILAKDARKKGLVAKPRTQAIPSPRRFETRYVPADLRRAVWTRDQGRCQWPLAGGGVCGSELRPELDHVHGFTPGEPVTADDLRILCRLHNVEHAREVYGDGYMDGFRRRAGTTNGR